MPDDINLADFFSGDELAQVEAALADAHLAMVREDETRAAVEAAGTDTIAAYWAQSASASVMRDYKAGRVVTIATPIRKR